MRVQVAEGGPVLAVTKDALDGGAAPVPVLRCGGLVRRGHVQVRQDERVGVDRARVFQLGDREAALAGVQGPAPPRPRVSRDLPGVQPDPADQLPCGGGPPVRAVGRHGDLGIVHAGRVAPALLADAVQQPPQRAILLAPIAKAMCSSSPARASAPAKYPASARGATRPLARARSGRAASAVSTASHCAAVIRRATPAAVVELRPGTGVICCPAASARWRSSPTRKSSPASCATAIPASSYPAPKPRSRCFTGPTAASSAPITPSRSHSPATAAIPPFGVSARSGAPTRTSGRFRFPRERDLRGE